MTKSIIISMFALVALLSFASTGFAWIPSTTPWTTYRYDTYHSGATPSEAPSSNNTLWARGFSTIGISNTATSLIVDGRVIFPVRDLAVAVDETTGIELWRHQTTGVLTASSYEDGRVFFGLSEGAGGIICINASSGEEIWTQDLSPNYVMGSPLVNNGIVYAGVTGNYTYAFDAATGHYKWGFMTDGPVYSSPAADGDVLFFGSDDTKLYALNVSGSTPVSLWNFTANSAVRSTPAISGGKVFFGSDSSELYTVNKTTGELIWSWATTGSSFKLRNGVALANNIVYVTSADFAKIYAIHADAAPGNYTESDLDIRYWTRDLSSEVSGFNEPVYANGTIIVTSTGGNPAKLYALNADVGNTLWDRIINWWPAIGNAIVADGRLWFSAYWWEPGSFTLYCIGDLFPPKTCIYQVNAGGNSYDIVLVTNSTATNFNTTALETKGKISFMVQGIGATDMTNITIPNNMLTGPFNVTVDGEQPLYLAPAINNGTHTSLYLTYNDTMQHTVEITGTNVIPEFPTVAIVPMLITTALFIALVQLRKHNK